VEKLNNYINYSICEKSYDLFNKTDFMTYRSFCNSLKNSINLDDLGSNEFKIVTEIANYLVKIYGLEFEDSVVYVGEFFLDDKFLVFEESVMLVNYYFKNSLN